MMCQMTGRPPTSIMGLGFRCDSSLIRVPYPPARMTHFKSQPLFKVKNILHAASGMKEGRSCQHIDALPVSLN
ncbi:MAG: hypothetical protein V1879_06275 [Pseudomonadota bacterium]